MMRSRSAPQDELQLKTALLAGGPLGLPLVAVDNGTFP